jgi:outer membrane lipoprotein SlyB
MKNIKYSLIVITLASTVGCTNMSNEEQGTLTGAGIGAAAGAAISSLSGGSGWTGAAVGAIAGGVIGNIRSKNASN